MIPSSQYIDEQRKEYSLYVMQMRAIPHIADGLKAGARRVIWIDRDGAKYKCAALAGATMPIHPHAAPDDTINTIASTYGNNIPLIKGKGAFGTLLKPTSYGASRYTSVSISQFTKDVILKDIDIIPMTDNYDGTLQEPKHFLPLVPVSLLNYQEGIAVGFACKILPRDLSDIIKDQIAHLRGKKFTEATPYFSPTNQGAVEFEGGGSTTKWYFEGEFEQVNATTIKITNLPYGIAHEKFIARLVDLEETNDSIIQEVEDNSSDHYDITVRFKKGALRRMTDDDVLTLLKLKSAVTENLNIIDFSGEKVWSASYTDIINKFTDWRLRFYVDRFKRLARLLEKDIQRYLDVITAIKKKVNAVASKTSSRKELKEYLKAVGIVNLDYIADLPIYRFTAEEKEKMENKVKEARIQLKEYKQIIASKPLRTEIYINELNEILKQFKKGVYTLHE